MDEIASKTQINLISDIVLNRPPALREFDQIYMKVGDMLDQLLFVSPNFDGKRTVFIGDGDGVGLAMIHLNHNGALPLGPTEIVVLDFDERIVNSINTFAEEHGLSDRIKAELYNVADPLPKAHWQRFDAFYTNPPYGEHNDGKSVLAFVKRGMEAVKPGTGLGCVVIGDDKDYCWTQEVLFTTQKMLIEGGYLIKSFQPEFSQYHLDDAPKLRSGSFFASGIHSKQSEYKSRILSEKSIKNFYGRRKALAVRYVREESCPYPAQGNYFLENYDWNQMKIKYPNE
ncbi:bis-aminopropyl spermidine synthase family protein [Puniceicoccales bacterium CK1056]|uniref:Bis-aminopropyl spermidine synthase family protein n=1 Tax=Oceanipulchritudo coccoides TaxID=2706888 RepID=A0A6B2M5A4_9BACT|nr:bis-aminopropyl spermidine synthase family protein [Oceanipulchritudo coccoides]NDV63359.1 bis-aminopropyl spermidine synthase family protein [Oceanipulchritudo coccoides]